MFALMPFEKITLAPAWALRLNDLAATDALVTKCFICDRVWRVPPHRLYAKFRAHTHVRDIVDFFTCRGCGGKTCTWHVERAFHEHDRPREGHQPQPPQRGGSPEDI